jgi:hypothetical protein
MITTNTMTAFAKIQAIVDAMMKMSEDGVTLPEAARDEVAVAELHTMMDMSVYCDHLPKRETNAIGFERAPRNICTIPSFIEDMKLPLNTSAHVQTRVRTNATICGFMTAVMAMSEFAIGCANASAGSYTIIVADVSSMKQLSMIKMLFEILQMCMIRDVKATMNVIVHEDMKRNAERILSRNTNIVLWPKRQAHWLEIVKEIRNLDPRAEATLVAEPETIGDTVTLMHNRAVRFISVAVDVSTIAQTRAVSDAAEQADAIMEVPPFMDPNVPTLRLASARVPAGTKSYRIVHRPAHWLIHALVSWHTKVIRPMNLGGMCCDCRVAFMIASGMLTACGYPDMDPSRQTLEEWSERFAGSVNATDIVDRNG